MVERDVMSRLDLLLIERDEIRKRSSLLVEEPVYLLDSRVRRLLVAVGDLEAGNHGSVLLLGRELIDSVEGGLRAACHEMRSDSPAVYRCAIRYEALDDLLSQIVGDADRCVLKPRLIEPAPDLLREIGEVSRVDPHADPLALRLLLKADLDRSFDARSKRVVCIDQEDSVIGVDLHELPECLLLGAIAHDPGMGHRSSNGDSELLARERVAGGFRASDEGSPRSRMRSVLPLSSPQAEFHDVSMALRGQRHPRGLRCDQGLEVDGIEYERFHELRIHEVALDSDQRLSGECRRAFIECIDIPMEAICPEILQEASVEHPEGVEVGDIIIGEGYGSELVDKLLDSGEYRVSALERVCSVEHVEYRPAIMMLKIVSLHHCQFIEVGYESAGVHGFLLYFLTILSKPQ